MKRIISVLAIALICALCLPTLAFAATVDSPVVEPKFKFNLVSDNPNAGSVAKEYLGDDTYTIKVNVSKGYTFKEWKIDGGYNLVEGKLTDKTVTIQVTKDTTAKATFKEGTSGGDDNPDSPKSGDSVALLVLVGMIALAGVGISFKKVIA